MAWARSYSKVAAAFCGGIATAMVLVWNAGRSLQALESAVTAQAAQIEQLDKRIQSIESALFVRSSFKGTQP